MSSAPEQTPSDKYTEKLFKSELIDEDLIRAKQLLSDYDVVYCCCKACIKEIRHGKRGDVVLHFFNRSNGRIFFVRTFLFLENKRLSTKKRPSPRIVFGKIRYVVSSLLSHPHKAVNRKYFILGCKLSPFELYRRIVEYCTTTRLVLQRRA